ALDGDWSVTMNGQATTTALKSWEAMGTTGFAGPAIYKKQFVASEPKGKRVYLEIGDVHSYAKVTLNGKDLGARAWGPYRWDATGALKAGQNDLQIEVQATPAGRGGPGAAAVPAPNATAGANAATPGARRRQAGAGAPAAAGTGAGRPAAPATPATSGLLGPVLLVAR
ncbi:MAG TPA: hypothetical protein VGN01_20365, partial [Acidobacteriaceae bacterium]